MRGGTTVRAAFARRLCGKRTRSRCAKIWTTAKLKMTWTNLLFQTLARWLLISPLRPIRSSWRWNMIGFTVQRLIQIQSFDCTTKGNLPTFAHTGHSWPTPGGHLEAFLRKLS